MKTRNNPGVKDILRTAGDIISTDKDPAGQFYLGDNYPDPFASVTTIPFRLAQASEVHIGIYDDQGAEVLHLLHDQMQAGEHKTVLSLAAKISSIPVGSYRYQLTVVNEHGTFSQSKLLTVK